MNNILRAQQILQWCESLGVSDICICPGGRNAPFVVALEGTNSFRVTSAFDERAAGFFAFGRSYSQQRPAVVITTSGTAAAELLPSVVEAHYTGTPLILITADRPQHLRGTGSPQVIDQLNIFGGYVEKCVDLNWNESWVSPSWNQQKPLHINISFEEPLIDGAIAPWETLSRPSKTRAPSVSKKEFLNAVDSLCQNPGVPLLIVGPLHTSEVAAVHTLCKTWPGVQYIEAASGLRESNVPGQLRSGEKYVSKMLRQNRWSGVLRIGGVPTLKLWRELENSNVPVVSLSSRPFAGLARGELFHADLSQLAVGPFDVVVDESLREQLLLDDGAIFEDQLTLLKKYPESEPAWVHRLSQQMAPEERVYIGNSLPIRQWDVFASYHSTRHTGVNRGANGIDGQIASAIGMATLDDNLSIIVGDLTALYDATGLWFKDQVQSLRLFVINNNGGRIFERLFNKKSFYNSHQVHFEGLATMWGIPYMSLKSTEPIGATGVFEIVPDADQTEKFWSDHDKLFR